MARKGISIKMKKVLVTGASGGIGRGISEYFAKKGYTVFAGYNKNEPKIENVRNIRIDVTSKESVRKAFEEIGGVDILINNSGISQQKLFSDITEEDWDNMFDVNIKGMYMVTKEALPFMINNKSGRIINISSIWGEIGGSMEVHYSASKAAVIGFTKALAKELSLSGITVNCVSPGMIDTPMNSHLSEEDIEEIEKEIPLKRQGTPKDVAEAVYFYASDMADYITGQVLSVSGGWNIV